jgi:hypothetical protein
VHSVIIALELGLDVRGQVRIVFHKQDSSCEAQRSLVQPFLQ